MLPVWGCMTCGGISPSYHRYSDRHDDYLFHITVTSHGRQGIPNHHQLYWLFKHLFGVHQRKHFAGPLWGESSSNAKKFSVPWRILFWHDDSVWLHIQYIPRNMHTVFALLCFVVVIHWLIFPYPSGLLHWHCGNLTIAPVPAKQPWWIWINTSCVFIMNDCITTTKQSTTKPCAYFLGYTVQFCKISNNKHWV